ncbi:hypothetical protein IWX64_003337 [Arthrobacter sp. CAN_A212]|uniref:hypothetical protein n=1 Tax=Arthrobacter sp. CAN_A212 TaxID=2787719 RepID=UPI0018C9CF26
MRHSAGRLNRTWLAIIGLLLTLTGTAWLLIATGILDTFLPSELVSPEASAPPVTADPAQLGSAPAVQGILIGVGALLALLALAWLAAQIPKRHQASRYRIQEDASTGMTTLKPDVLQDAVNAEIEMIPDVLHARSVLRGSAGSPDLTIRVTLSSRADTQRVLATIREEAIEHFAASLGAPLARLAVEVDMDTRTRKSSTVTL